MNEHDSKEAHEARNATAERLVSVYHQNYRSAPSDEALRDLLNDAWECGHDFARRNDHE